MLRVQPQYLVSGLVIAILVLLCIAYLLRAMLRTRNLPVCWHCGASKVRRSAPQCVLDTITHVLFLKPYRCRGCLTRFYGFHRPREASRPSAALGITIRRPL